MAARRSPDSPNRLEQNAQRSAFDGAVGGKLRSARPVGREEANRIPSTAGNGSAGRIYKVADGFTDVSDGDFLLDRAGMLWYKDGSSWKNLFGGQIQTYPRLGEHHPKDIGQSSGGGWNSEEIIIGSMSPALVGESPSGNFRDRGNILLGFETLVSAYNSIVIANEGGTVARTADSVVIGHQNDISNPGAESWSGYLFNDSTLVGNYNRIQDEGDEADAVDINIFGSRNFLNYGNHDGGSDMVTLLGAYNTLQVSNGLYETTVVGSYNGVYDTADAGFSSQLTLLILGSQNGYFTQEGSDRSGGNDLIIVGHDSYVYEGSNEGERYGGNLSVGSGVYMNSVHEAIGIGPDTYLNSSPYSTAVGSNASSQNNPRGSVFGHQTYTQGGSPYGIGASFEPGDVGEVHAFGSRLGAYSTYHSMILGTNSYLGNSPKSTLIGVGSNMFDSAWAFLAGSDAVLSDSPHGIAIGARSSLVGAPSSWIFGSNAHLATGWTPPGWSAPIVADPLALEEYGVLVAQKVEVQRSLYAPGSTEASTDLSTYFILAEADGTKHEIGVTSTGITFDGVAV